MQSRTVARRIDILSNQRLTPLVFTDVMPLTQCGLLYTRKKMSDADLKSK